MRSFLRWLIGNTWCDATGCDRRRGRRCSNCGREYAW